MLVAKIGMETTIADDAMLGGAGCDAASRRPDTLFIRADAVPSNITKPLSLVNGRAVFIEIDERGGHPDRLDECETGKMWDQTVALKKLCGEDVRVFFVRFNPDEYDGARSTLEQRVASVGAHCKWILSDGWREFESAAVPHVSYHYYHSKCNFHIEYVRARPDSFNLYLVHPETTSTTSTYEGAASAGEDGEDSEDSEDGEDGEDGDDGDDGEDGDDGDDGEDGEDGEDSEDGEDGDFRVVSKILKADAGCGR
jgi:hypothetical protein